MNNIGKLLNFTKAASVKRNVKIVLRKIATDAPPSPGKKVARLCRLKYNRGYVFDVLGVVVGRHLATATIHHRGQFCP